MKIKLDQNPHSESSENVLNERSNPLIFENLKWLNSREAVIYLRLPSEGALRNLVYRRQIPFVKLGRSLRFDKKALDQFLESSLTPLHLHLNSQSSANKQRRIA
jgi:excisionase family DNA binding protein